MFKLGAVGRGPVRKPRATMLDKRRRAVLRRLVSNDGNHYLHQPPPLIYPLPSPSSTTDVAWDATTTDQAVQCEFDDIWVGACMH